MYFVVSGGVEVRLEPEPVLLRAGAFFGEMSLLPGSPRNATIITIQPCTLLALDIVDFASFSAASPISPELSMRKRTASSRLASAPGGERLVIMWREARGGAGLAIEGRFQLASEKAPNAILKNCLRRQAATAAESIKPAHPGGHMTDLVAIDPP
jgi:CRP-like cAMP-binding protein